MNTSPHGILPAVMLAAAGLFRRTGKAARRVASTDDRNPRLFTDSRGVEYTIHGGGLRRLMRKNSRGRARREIRKIYLDKIGAPGLTCHEIRRIRRQMFSLPRERRITAFRRVAQDIPRVRVMDVVDEARPAA